MFVRLARAQFHAIEHFRLQENRRQQRLRPSHVAARIAGGLMKCPKTLLLLRRRRAPHDFAKSGLNTIGHLLLRGWRFSYQHFERAILAGGCGQGLGNFLGVTEQRGRGRLIEKIAGREILEVRAIILVQPVGQTGDALAEARHGGVVNRRAQPPQARSRRCHVAAALTKKRGMIHVVTKLRLRQLLLRQGTRFLRLQQLAANPRQHRRAFGRIWLLLLRRRHVSKLQLLLYQPPCLQRALGHRRSDAFQRQLAFLRFVVVAVEAVALEKRHHGFPKTGFIHRRLGCQRTQKNENRRAHHSTIRVFGRERVTAPVSSTAFK